MVIWQGIFNSLYQRCSSKNLLSHLVHGRLDRGAIIFRESLESNSACSLPGGIKLLKVSFDLGEASEAAPVPGGGNIGAENPVPGLLEGSVLVTEEAPELRTGTLQHGQTVDGRADVNPLAFGDIDLDITSFGAGLDKGVRVWFTVDFHTLPAVGHDLDVRGMNVAIFLHKM